MGGTEGGVIRRGGTRSLGKGSFFYSLIQKMFPKVCNCVFCMYSDILHSYSSMYCTMVTMPISVLYCTALYCNVRYCTVMYCTVLYGTVWYCTVLYRTVLHCTVLYNSHYVSLCMRSNCKDNKYSAKQKKG